MSRYASLVDRDFCPEEREWIWFTFGNFSAKGIATTCDTILRVGDVISVGTEGALIVITSIYTSPPGELVGVYIVSPQSCGTVRTDINAVIHLRGRRIAR